MRQRFSGSSGPLADTYGRQSTASLTLNIRVPYSQIFILLLYLSQYTVCDKDSQIVGCNRLRLMGHPALGPLICAYLRGPNLPSAAYNHLPALPHP